MYHRPTFLFSLDTDIAGSRPHAMKLDQGPCPMCLGAIYWARLSRVYFANAGADASRIGFDDSLIYREIAQPLSQRKIPMIQMMREEALAAFRAWENKSNKIGY